MYRLKLRQSLLAIASVLTLISAVAMLTPLTARGQGGQTKPPQDVNVVNTPSVNVANPVVLAPGASVGIDAAANIVKVDDSTPVAVRGVEQPYMAHLSANNFGSGGGEACTEIPVPAGKRLALETVAARVSRNSIELPGDPTAYVRAVTLTGTGSAFDRGLVLPLIQLSNSEYGGHLRTRFLSGPLTVGDGMVTLSLCAGPYTTVRGHVIGSLLPL